MEDGMTAIASAAREGRIDVLKLSKQRGIPAAVDGIDRLIAAFTMGNAASAFSIVDGEPNLVGELRAMGGGLLAKFAGTGNLTGVAMLLDLGVDVDAPFTEGDGYFDEPKNCLAIHVAAWRCNPAIVKLLIKRGSPVDAPDVKGRTPWRSPSRRAWTRTGPRGVHPNQSRHCSTRAHRRAGSRFHAATRKWTSCLGNMERAPEGWNETAARRMRVRSYNQYWRRRPIRATNRVRRNAVPG